MVNVGLEGSLSELTSPCTGDASESAAIELEVWVVVAQVYFCELAPRDVFLNSKATRKGLFYGGMLLGMLATFRATLT
jgi:hypothetical protein